MDNSPKEKPYNEIVNQTKKYLHEDAKAFYNKSEDLIIESRDGLRQIRFDFNKTSPHLNKHIHVIRFIRVGNKKIEIMNERIYPAGVIPE